MQKLVALFKAFLDLLCYFFLLLLGVMMIPETGDPIISQGAFVLMAGALIAIPFGIWRLILRLKRAA